MIRAFGETYPEAFFIEVGSNDGEHHDHLRPLILDSRWRGIMVEPVPYVFERLRRNYGALERVELANVAIAEQDGRLPFFHLREATDDEREGLPGWYHAVGSFSRETVMRHAGEVSDIESRIVETDVPCVTFESLCRRHGVDGLDLLLVDTEGFDWNVIRQVDLEARRPRLIVYEHYHLPPAERAECRAHLERHGYDVMEEHFDTFALARDADPRLRELWGTLRPGIGGLSVHDR